MSSKRSSAATSKRPADDVPDSLELAAEVSLVSDGLADRAAEDDQKQRARGHDAGGCNEHDRDQPHLPERDVSTRS